MSICGFIYRLEALTFGLTLGWEQLARTPDCPETIARVAGTTDTIAQTEVLIMDGEAKTPRERIIQTALCFKLRVSGDIADALKLAELAQKAGVDLPAFCSGEYEPTENFRQTDAFR